MAPRSPYTAIKNVRLLPETLAYLDDLALRNRTTSSDLIRRAVDDWLARRFQVAREAADDANTLPLPGQTTLP